MYVYVNIPAQLQGNREIRIVVIPFIIMQHFKKSTPHALKQRFKYEQK